MKEVEHQVDNLMRKLWRVVLILAVILLYILKVPSCAQQFTKTIEIKTQEVTRPDVAVSPDGKWLIFTALGHLLRLDVEGGKAEQLTFGPYYDSDPAISPDGQIIVFASDRDLKSNGNLFILELSTGKIRQLTEENWAARPIWSPDGKSIVYLSYQPEGLWAEYEFVAPLGLRTQVRQISAQGGSITVHTKEFGYFHDVFYLPDGRLAWSVVEMETKERPAQSRIEVMTSSEDITEISTFEGVVDRVVPDSTGEGLYLRRYKSAAAGKIIPQPEHLVYASLRDDSERKIADLLSPQPRPKFSVSGNALYFGEGGQLFRIDSIKGDRQQIKFSAEIKMEVFHRTEPIRYIPKQQFDKPNSILDPQISNDGKYMIFTAAGFIWQQSLKGGEAKQLFPDKGFQWGAAAISPDGQNLAYQHSEGNVQELRVSNLMSGEVKTLVTTDRSGRFEPSWSPDGKKLIYVGFTKSMPSIFILDVSTGKKEKIVDSFPRWMPRPHFSADGKYVYYTSRNQIYRLNIQKGLQPEPITQIKGFHVADGLVSPNEKWIAFRHNEEIWAAPLNQKPVTDKEVFRLTQDGGLNFSFAPDSKAIIYSVGNKVWTHPLTDGQPTEISLKVKFPGKAPKPALVKNIRVLDFEAGRFTEESSMYIDQGRIQWIEQDSKRNVPDNVKIIDAKGRYAIPGLIDMHIHIATPIHFIPARDVSQISSLIAHGVTAVRDMGSDITLQKNWNDRRRGYGAPVPRIFSGGAMIESHGTFFHGGSFFAKDEDEGRGLVKKEKDDGAMTIKSYFTLTWPLHRAMAEEARQQKIPVASHGLLFRETVMGIVLGRATIEHQVTPARIYDDVMQLFAKTGTRWDLTIGVGGGNGLLFSKEPQLLSCSILRAFTSQSDYKLAEAADVFKDLSPSAIKKSYSDLLASINQAKRTGVTLLAGTDALNPNVYYGHSVHMEFKHHAAAGIPSIDLLRMSTIEAAKTVGAEDQLGSLEPGKLADIVILDKNPLEDINNARSIWRVIQGGRVFSSNPDLEER